MTDWYTSSSFTRQTKTNIILNRTELINETGQKTPVIKQALQAIRKHKARPL